jgi:cysteine desulfurase / selenocysteine lyase
MPFFPEAPPPPPITPRPDKDSYLAEYRASQPILKKFSYCNHASVGPLSDWVIAAVNEQLTMQQMAESCVQDPWFDYWRATRQRCGELIGAARDEVTILTSTNEACMRVCSALPLGPGAEALCPADEFPSVHKSLSELSRRGVRVVEAPSARGDGIVRTQDLLDAITPRTRLIATSWVNFFHGYTHDLHALGEACRERGIWLLVDAMQGLGALALNVKDYHIHFLVGHGAKWLCAPIGATFLYVSREVPPEITPQAEGWLGMELNHLSYTDRSVTAKTNANRFMIGSIPWPGMFGLRRAVEVFLDAGPEHAQQRALANADALEAAGRIGGLAVYSERAPLRSAIVSLSLPEGSTLPDRLRSANVVFSVREGKLRLSPHWYMTDAELGPVQEILSTNL